MISFKSSLIWEILVFIKALGFRNLSLVEVGSDLMISLSNEQSKFLTNFLKMKVLGEIFLMMMIISFQFSQFSIRNSKNQIKWFKRSKINLEWVGSLTMDFLIMMTFFHRALDKEEWDFLLNFPVACLVVIIIMGQLLQKVFQLQQ